MTEVERVAGCNRIVMPDELLSLREQFHSKLELIQGPMLLSELRDVARVDRHVLIVVVRVGIGSCAHGKKGQAAKV